MRWNKKILAFGMTTTFALSMLGGCGAETNGSGENDTKSTVVAFANTSLTGTVTKIDGDTITLTLSGGMGGGMPGGMMNDDMKPDDVNGNNPESTSEQKNENAPEQATPPEKPEGNDGEQMEKNMEQNNMSETGTTFTLTVKNEDLLENITLDDITAGSLLTITFGNDNEITSISLSESTPNKPGEPGGGADTVNTGTGATTITENKEDSNTTYVSEKEDENALRADGSISYTASNLTIEKSGDTSNSESSDFYGLNAGFLALNGAATTISDSTITTNAKGANGIFAYGEGSSVKVSNTSISTSADNSGGIDVTGGASIQAKNLNIETNGNSSAAIRSDRGGGSLNVTEGTYTTNGTGSPAVYCTADITVSDAILTANASEGVVIEGKNNVTLKNCTVTGNMQGTYQGDENENLHTIMIYQSMSGDAEEGEAEFSMTGGSITGKNGDLIYSTNTSSVVNLEQVSLSLANDTLLRIVGNDGSRGWGSSGSNGGDMSLFATNQVLQGNIIVDEISSLTLTLSESSSFEGSINEQEEGGTVSVSLDDSSSWTLTGDSYITSFEGSLDNITFNGFQLYVDGKLQNPS